METPRWKQSNRTRPANRRGLLSRFGDSFAPFLHRTAQAARLTDVSLRIEDVNAELALGVRIGQRLESIFVLSIDDDVISGIRVVRNPDKLAHIDRQLTIVH